MGKLVSIIIPCKILDEYASQCIQTCLSLDHVSIEVIVLPDSLPDSEMIGVKFVPTGPVTPGKKRNLGVHVSKGEVVAFIDSDAYPRKDWLKNALRYLENDDIVGVGGPGLTPPEDSALQRASGMVFETPLMGGLSRRYSEHGTVESDDVHSCNFVVKKAALDGIEWNEKYWPGEDTLVSLDLRKKKNGKLIEASDVVVYHHRRPLFIKHLKQVSAFGLHRGFFAKRYPENSRKAVYALPSLLVLTFIAFVIFSVFISPYFWIPIAAVIVGFAIASIVPSSKDAKLFPIVWIGLIATHLVYGFTYIEGILRRELPR